MRVRPALLVGASLPLALAACAHGRLPAWQSTSREARSGDRTADGVVLLLDAPEASVRTALTRSIAVNGYQVVARGASDRTLATAARALGGDTSLVTRAEITPVDRTGGGVVVVLSGTYSVPSARVRDARVVQRPGERNALYARLRAIADTTRRYVEAAP